MNKGKITMTMTIGLICFILTYVMFVQFKTIRETDLTSIKNMRETDLRTELSTWKSKYEEANKKYQEIILKRDEYELKMQSNEESSELIEKELQEANTVLGMTNVKGNGIIITLTDNNEKNIESFDLLQLINELKIAGAQAISINGERIVNMSDIATISSGFIIINGERLLSPFIVSAIGNQDDLENELTRKRYGYMDSIIKGNGKTATIERKNNIQIPKYNGNMTLNYINK